VFTAVTAKITTGINLATFGSNQTPPLPVYNEGRQVYPKRRSALQDYMVSLSEDSSLES
jgi:hypothetical protein